MKLLLRFLPALFIGATLFLILAFTFHEKSETLMLDTHQGTEKAFSRAVVSKERLKTGKPYTVSVSGTMSFWTHGHWREFCGDPDSGPRFPSPGVVNGLVGQDAEYSYGGMGGGPQCMAGACHANPFSIRRLEVSLNGGETFAPLSPTPPAYTRSHQYTYLITGQGFPAQFRYKDSPVDDYGQFRITLQTGKKLPKTSASGDCGTF